MFAQTRMWGPSEMAQRLESLREARDLRRQQKPAGTGHDLAAAPIPPVQPAKVAPGDRGPHGDGRSSVPGHEPSSIFPPGTTSEPGVSASRSDHLPPAPSHGPSHSGRHNSNITKKRDKQAPAGLKKSIEGGPEPATPKSLKNRSNNSVGSGAQTPDRPQGNLAGKRQKQRALGLGETMRPGRKPNSRLRGVTKGKSRPLLAPATADNGLREDAGEVLRLCAWCGRDLSYQKRHTCRDCPFDLCSTCIVNQPAIYPDHRGDHDCRESPAGARLASDGSDAGGEEQATPVVGAVPAGQPICVICEAQIRGARYECQQCPDIHLCEEDRVFHVSGHALRRVLPEDTTPVERQASTGDLRDDTHDSDDSDNSRNMDDSVDTGDDKEMGAGIHGSGDSDNGSNDDSESSDLRQPRRSPSAQASPAAHFGISPESYSRLYSLAKAIVEQGPPPGHEGTDAAKSSSRRQWLPEDKRQLRKLKRKGHTDEEVAARLGRSVGAVKQQWRKLQ